MYLINWIKEILGFELLVKEKPECGDSVNYFWGENKSDKIVAINYNKNIVHIDNSFYYQFDIRDLYWNKYSESWNYNTYVRERKTRLDKLTEGKGWEKC